LAAKGIRTPLDPPLPNLRKIASTQIDLTIEWQFNGNVHCKHHERHFGLAYHHRKRENLEFLGKTAKNEAILGMFRIMKQK
jgi:hypothetical protein